MAETRIRGLVKAQKVRNRPKSASAHNPMMPLIHECADPQDAETILFLKTRRLILVAQLRYLDRKVIELVNSNGWQCTTYDDCRKQEVIV